MRKNRAVSQEKEFSILTLDDDRIMTLTLQSYFESLGFQVDMENDPQVAVERIRNGHYDILLLDFLMTSMNGDEVVRRVREFNKDIFIVLLTGHKSMAPPLKTIRDLDIQGYYEKSDRFDQLELLVESCTKAIKQMRTIRSYKDGLHSILEQMPVLARIKSTQEVLKRIMEQMNELLGWYDGLVYIDFKELGADILNESGTHSHFWGVGAYNEKEDYGKQGLAEFLSKGTSRILVKDNLRMAALTADDGAAFGVIMSEAKKAEPEEKDQLFAVYAKQVGAVLSGLVYQEILQSKNEALSKAYMETIDVLRKMVDAKDYYTRGHSDRVSCYGELIAKAMEMDDGFVARVRVGGLFHDIGKIGIPDAILRKPSSLDDVEYANIKRHTIMGRQMLASVSSLQDILPIVECHHERYDGKGYPLGISGDRISLEARVISVADSFDAMTSKRSYRSNLSLDEAITELNKGKGTQFDPGIVDIFLGVITHSNDVLEQLNHVFPDGPNQENREA